MSLNEEKLLMSRIHDPNDHSRFTYQTLKDALNRMTPEQLKQTPMVLPPDPTSEPPQLEPVYAFGTVVEMLDDGEVRSADDDKHHPEQVVLCRDWAPFSKEGDFCYKDTGEDHEDEHGAPNATMIGDKTGKKFVFGHLEVKEYDTPNGYSYKDYILGQVTIARLVKDKAIEGRVLRYLYPEGEDGSELSVVKDVFDAYLAMAMRVD